MMIDMSGENIQKTFLFDLALQQTFHVCERGILFQKNVIRGIHSPPKMTCLC